MSCAESQELRDFLNEYNLSESRHPEPGVSRVKDLARSARHRMRDLHRPAASHAGVVLYTAPVPRS
jgi:hypothetical protein